FACGLATVAPLRGDVAAAALPALPFACGLATVAPLRGDVAAASLPALPFVCGLATVAPLGGDVAAAALPALPFACGPATAAPFRGDVVAAPLLPVVGAVPVRRPSPGPAALARYAPRGPEAGWVLDRMAVADRLGWPAV
ncbi:MAG: hypothetical protein ACRD0K_14245, partial [Egibacteraceae bacterium]